MVYPLVVKKRRVRVDLRIGSFFDDDILGLVSNKVGVKLGTIRFLDTFIVVMK